MISSLPRQTVTNGELSLSYIKFGTSGPNIITLHGHGRTAEDFIFLKENGIVISIDLFFHGQSIFPENRIEKKPLETDEFYHLFKSILVKEGVTTYHLVAFSQGGRFALSIIPIEINNILSIQLISPDGMDNKSFYNRMSRKKWARNLFVKWEKNPIRLVNYSRFARILGIMRPKVFLFVQKFAADKKSFFRASCTWRGFRAIQPNENELKSCLKTYSGLFRIIMGKHDQVIRTKQAKNFLKRIESEKALLEIDCGHDFFNEKNRSSLKKVISIK